MCFAGVATDLQPIPVLITMQLYARYFCSRTCMQDTIARARTRSRQAKRARATIGYIVNNSRTHSAAARPSARATIGYIVYKQCSNSVHYFHATLIGNGEERCNYNLRLSDWFLFVRHWKVPYNVHHFQRIIKLILW